MKLSVWSFRTLPKRLYIKDESQGGVHSLQSLGRRAKQDAGSNTEDKATKVPDKAREIRERAREIQDRAREIHYRAMEIHYWAWKKTRRGWKRGKTKDKARESERQGEGKRKTRQGKAREGLAWQGKARLTILVRNILRGNIDADRRHQITILFHLL